MREQQHWDLGPGFRVVGTEHRPDRWVVIAEPAGQTGCPDCGLGSACRHSAYVRRLQDLPVQGKAVEVHLRTTRWRYVNPSCPRKTFAGRSAPAVAAYARQTGRAAELVRLVGHAAGGRPAERLLRRLGMPQGDDRILRHLKRHAAAVPHGLIRVVGIDDWSWRRGTRYGTVVVDLERRAVVDVLPDRSAATMTAWLQAHPSIEMVSRDRCGLYAQAARQGAPQALQVADRFHLVQNLRLAIERQLSRAPRPMKLEHKAPRRVSRPSLQREQQELSRKGRRLVWLDQFTAVKRLQQEGKSLAAIVTQTGLNWRTVAKWAASDTLPERHRMDPRPSSFARFKTFLAQRWAEGCRNGRYLLEDLRKQGYTGSRTALEELLCEWRRDDALPIAHQQADDASSQSASVVPPIAASILCMAPRPQLTARQASKVDLLKEQLPDFAAMRRFAMRFRGILRGEDPATLDAWLNDVRHSGLHALRRFAQSSSETSTRCVTRSKRNGAMVRRRAKSTS